MRIYYIDLEAISNQTLLEEYIYPNMEHNYYWSDSFEDIFYIKLAQAGFISTSMKDMDNNAVLLPEIQFEYALLHFEDLHVSQKVSKLLKQKDYELSINTKLPEVLDNIHKYHELSWLSKEYQEMLLHLSLNTYDNFELISVELVDKSTHELIAGEIGYTVGRTYTSLTGFFKREKKYNNWGKLQLVLLAQFLHHKGYDFWNLGHASLQYKQDMGAKIYKREDFLYLWKQSCQNSFK